MEIENPQNLILALRIIAIVLGVDFLARLAMLWTVLSDDEGADRVCWVLVLSWFPLFGTAAWTLIWRAERDRRQFNDERLK